MAEQAMDKTIVRSNGVELAYRTYRSGQEKPFLVFVHGLGGSLNCWDLIIEAFHREGFSTLMLDLRGHGLSSRIDSMEAYQFDELGDDIAYLLNEEKIDDYYMIAHCFGGNVLLHNLCNSSGNDVERLKPKALILAAVGARPPAIMHHLIKFTVIQKLVAAIAKVLPATYKHERALVEPYLGTGDINLRRFCSDVSHTSLPVYFRVSRYLASYDVSMTAAKITIPTLLISGRKDSIITPKNIQRLHERMPCSELKILEDANHVSIVNQAEEVTSCMLEWLRSLPAKVQ